MSDKKGKKKRKKYYFIDYENVHRTGLNGISELDKSDNIIVFYSKNADKLPFSLHSQIIETKAKITYFEVETVGKNALDFQLASYIGYIVGKHPKSIFHIISKDAGFENVCNFWRKNGIKICLGCDIAQSKKSDSLKKSEIKEVLNSLELDAEDTEFIRELITKSSERYDVPIPKIKCEINQQLCRKFGNMRTKEIYAKIKPLIK